MNTEKTPHQFSVRRKLQRQGGSLLVTIPKLWADAESLKQGDRVTIVFDGDIRILSPRNGGKTGAIGQR